jgi:hypothetical protein
MAKSQKQIIQERVEQSGVTNLEGISWRALTTYFGKQENYDRWNPDGINCSQARLLWFGRDITYIRDENGKAKVIGFFDKTPFQIMRELGIY